MSNKPATTAASDELKIEQRHRDAAVKYAGHGYSKGGSYSDGYWITKGEYDHHPLVQAFAQFERDHLAARPTSEAWIRHDERKRIIAAGCIHTVKAAKRAGAGQRPDIRDWQDDQHEYFGDVILEIVSEYAEWRDARQALSRAQERG